MSFAIANEFRVLFGKEKLAFADTHWNLPYIKKICDEGKELEVDF